MVDLSLKNLYDMVMEMIATKKITMDTTVNDLLRTVLSERAALGDE